MCHESEFPPQLAQRRAFSITTFHVSSLTTTCKSAPELPAPSRFVRNSSRGRHSNSIHVQVAIHRAIVGRIIADSESAEWTACTPAEGWENAFDLLWNLIINYWTFAHVLCAPDTPNWARLWRWIKESIAMWSLRGPAASCLHSFSLACMTYCDLLSPFFSLIPPNSYSFPPASICLSLLDCSTCCTACTPHFTNHF